MVSVSSIGLAFERWSPSLTFLRRMKFPALFPLALFSRATNWRGGRAGNSINGDQFRAGSYLIGRIVRQPFFRPNAISPRSALYWPGTNTHPLAFMTKLDAYYARALQSLSSSLKPTSAQHDSYYSIPECEFLYAMQWITSCSHYNFWHSIWPAWALHDMRQSCRS
jgi:hypothetical protein